MTGQNLPPPTEIKADKITEYTETLNEIFS